MRRATCGWDCKQVWEDCWSSSGSANDPDKGVLLIPWTALSATRIDLSAWSVEPTKAAGQRAPSDQDSSNRIGLLYREAPRQESGALELSECDWFYVTIARPSADPTAVARGASSKVSSEGDRFGMSRLYLLQLALGWRVACRDIS